MATTQSSAIGCLEVPLMYETIRRELAGRLGRQWRAGARLPSTPELARELGTGQRNTHRAVRELVAAGLLISRRGRGTFVSPHFNEAQRMTAATGAPRPQTLLGRRIAVYATTAVSDPFLGRMHDALTESLVGAGAAVQRESLVSGLDFRAVTREHADALVVINPNLSHRLAFDPAVPALVLSTTEQLTVCAAGGYDMVAVDERAGGYLAGERFRKAGFTSACFVGVAAPGATQAFDATSAVRLDGFEAGFERTVPPEHRLYAPRYGEGSGSRAVMSWLALKPRPDAVFVASDELAVGFVIGAQAHGLTPGHDYHVIGFDGQQRGRELADGPLTTVEVSSAAMGLAGAELLTARVLDPSRPVRRLHIGCTLFEGATVKGPST